MGAMAGVDAPTPSGLPPLTPRAAPPGPHAGLPPLGPAPAVTAHVVRVREVMPRWQKLLVIGCAVVGAVAGAASLYLQVAGGDAVSEKVTPIADLAERSNNGLARVDAAVARARALLEAVPGAAPPPSAPATRPAAPAEYRVGPFVVRRGDGFIELESATPDRADRGAP
jgi:hypothetical protein